MSFLPQLHPPTLQAIILDRLLCFFFLNLCLLSPLISAITVCVCVSNEILKVNQNSRVIDYMPMPCHIRLTQIDCTVHYSVSAWKINKYGENPPRAPLSHPMLVDRWRIMLLWCVHHSPGRQVVHRHHSNLAYSISTPLTRHSCIAKHHLVLFCLQQSQLTKTDNNSCCKTKAKQRGLGGEEERLDWSPVLKNAPRTELRERNHSEVWSPLNGHRGGLLLKLEILIHLPRTPSNLRQVVIYSRNYAAQRHLSFCSLSRELMTPCQLKMKTPYAPPSYGGTG